MINPQRTKNRIENTLIKQEKKKGGGGVCKFKCDKNNDEFCNVEETFSVIKDY